MLRVYLDRDVPVKTDICQRQTGDIPSSDVASPRTEQYQPMAGQDMLMFIHIFFKWLFLLFCCQGAQRERR